MTTATTVRARVFVTPSLHPLPGTHLIAILKDPAAQAAMRVAATEVNFVLACGETEGTASEGGATLLQLGRVTPGQIVTICVNAGRPDQGGTRMLIEVQAHVRARVLRVEEELAEAPSDDGDTMQVEMDEQAAVRGQIVLCETLPDSVELAPEEALRARETFSELAQAYRNYAHALLQNDARPPADPKAFGDLNGASASARVSADTIMGVSEIDLGEQRAILECLDVAARFRLSTEALKRATARIETRTQIDREVALDYARAQREQILQAEKRKIDEELAALNPSAGASSDYRAKISVAKMPPAVEKKALEDANRLDTIPAFSPEVAVLRTYLDWLTQLPWSGDPPAEPGLEPVRRQLDSDHYGLERAKENILDFVATQMYAKDGALRSPLLCFVGPPGVGKTSLAKSIARALGRPVQRISLGGMNTESEIRGHRKTYVGALPGKPIQTMKTLGTPYAVIILDELDKLGSHSMAGDPAAALLELLDPEQNREFTDHYIELPFDFSRVMFICTANDAAAIPPALIDRLHVIDLPGYTEGEKLAIAKGYIIPKLLAEYTLPIEQFQPDDALILAVIRGYTYEAGVRDLERRFKTLISKVIRGLIEKTPSESLDLAFLEKHLGAATDRRELVENVALVGASTALFYSPLGGGTLPVQVSTFPPLQVDRPEIESTGSLGETMRESVKVARSHLHANAERYGIPDTAFRSSIHVHFPAGAQPKDGPSAGLAIAAALRSALTGIPIRQDIAMTGEIDGRGRAMRIGGLREKLFGAKNAGCKIVLVPERNLGDLVDVPASTLEGIEVRPVREFEDVWRELTSGPAVSLELPVSPGSTVATEIV